MTAARRKDTIQKQTRASHWNGKYYSSSIHIWHPCKWEKAWEWDGMKTLHFPFFPTAS